MTFRRKVLFNHHQVIKEITKKVKKKTNTLIPHLLLIEYN